MVQDVIKRDGTKEKFDAKKISVAVTKAAREVYPLPKAEEVTKKTVFLVLRTLSRKRSQTVSIEDIQDVIEESLMELGYVGVARKYILYREFRHDIRITKHTLGVKDELKLSLNANAVLRERYLLRNNKRKVIETPQQLFERVARSIARAERNFKSKEEAGFQKCFFEIMAQLEFLPNSPTLMNAGTLLNQLSACFVLPVGDSIEEIFAALGNMATIHKTGGGTGFDFSALRPEGDLVFSTKGKASGPLSFMKIFDTATSIIVQGGRRRGANMGVLRVDHPDIEKFVQAKIDGKSFTNFNLSVGVTLRFMDAVRSSREFKLINPRTKKCVKKINAQELFSMISFCAYKCGDPGLVFLDHINKTHPLKNIGEIETTNPCGELPLLPYESCTLGSLNLSKFVKNKKIDWGRLKEVVWLGIRFLDNVIEVNQYPSLRIADVTRKNRKIGLGIMGFADMLVKLRIPYNSQKAVTCASKVMKYIRDVSCAASCHLAKTRGVFPHWKHSSYKKKNIRLRNATLNSIAPTGSISIIAGCSSGIEPLFALSYTRNILGRVRLYEVNSLLEEIAKEEGVYSRQLMERLQGQATLKMIDAPEVLKRIFVTAFDINPGDHLNIQAAFQKYVDNAASKTINLPKEATPQDVKDIYMKAFELKLKGITIYRYGSAQNQVLTFDDPSYERVSVDQDYAGDCFFRRCTL